MKINGELEEHDALILLRAARLARAHLGESEHVILTGTAISIGGLAIELTIGQFLDHILRPYREYE